MDDPMDPTPDIDAVVAAIRALDDPAPESLRRAVADAVARAPRPRARRPLLARPRVLAPALGLAAAFAVVLALVLGGGGGGPAAPSVRAAAQVALRDATQAPPPARAGGRMLAASVEGVAFPTWSRGGWRVVGQRRDTLGGHAIRTVFYAHADGARVGYAIAAGDALPLSDGRLAVHRGVRFRVMAVDGAAVVTWRRAGHTCILAARGMAPERLMRLATYAT